MSTIRSFIRREPVLLIAALAAAASCFFVPPDAQYLGYIDFRTLALLYCLMTVVAGLRQAGLFAHLAHTLCLRVGNLRAMCALLVGLCFFSSMLITNDVALLTFVPFAVVPQNLYLYSYYDLSPAAFFSATFPIWALSLLLIGLCCFSLSKERMEVFLGEEPGMDARGVALHALLFIVCLLVVLRVITWPVMLAVVIAVLLVLDRKLLLKADFMLLLTFVAFFIFAGNLARVGAVDALLRRLLGGREYWTSLLFSQVISNVPAALLLSGFTDRSRELLLGVNIGGLGTPIASLASLISMKLYAHSDSAHPLRYLAEFTFINVLLLLILSFARLIL